MYYKTEVEVVNIFTKELPNEKFCKFKDVLGISPNDNYGEEMLENEHLEYSRIIIISMNCYVFVAVVMSRKYYLDKDIFSSGNFGEIVELVERL